MVTPVRFPVARSRPLDPPDELHALRTECPVARMTYPDGHVGWLVTSHAAVRAVLADVRFSSRYEVVRLPHKRSRAASVPPPGFFISQDPPDHTKYRRVLAGEFTLRRMRLLVPEIERITERRLDDLASQEQPADLVTAVGTPIPALVLATLLGIPADKRTGFLAAADLLVRPGTPPRQYIAAMNGITTFLRELVAGRLAEPGLLSTLATNDEITVAEAANIGLLILVAGHETTANMLTLGTLALLRHPDQCATLRADPSLMPGAVDELLRYLSVAHIGPVRTATEDVELAGQLIRAGDTVTVSLPAANRDANRFPDPDTLDVSRPDGAGHVAFGHGVHLCIGQHLARLELGVVYPALLRRFPALRLAVPPEEIVMRDGTGAYGVRQLPVRW